jgi:hypothetical protein
VSNYRGDLKERHDRLQVFLYTLMRDELNTGAVEKVMDHVRATKGASEVRFTSKHLAAYADCLAEELLLGVAGGCCDKARFGNGKPVDGEVKR